MKINRNLLHKSLSSNKVLVFILIVLISYLLVFFSFTFKVSKNNNIKKVHIVNTHIIDTHAQDIISADTTSTSYTKEPITGTIVGGIVPHHLLPRKILAQFFKTLASQSPQTIVLIVPNHFERGSHPLLTSTYAWKTTVGTVMPDFDLASSLIDKNVVLTDETTAVKEHAITGLMPYFAYYLPQSKVVLVMVSNKISLTTLKKTAAQIHPLLNKDTIVIASVDFSHYLNSKEAMTHDQITLATIKKYDLNTLMTFDNSFVDSPSSLTLLLLLMTTKGNVTQKLLNNTNSGILTGKNYNQVTSYISMLFVKNTFK